MQISKPGLGTRSSKYPGRAVGYPGGPAGGPAGGPGWLELEEGEHGGVVAGRSAGSPTARWERVGMLV